MINSSHALVFAMLSTASGWGFPSLDSLLSPNESTHVTGEVDGPRDRRQLGSGSRCDSDWSVLSTPRPKLSSLTCRCLLARSQDPDQGPGPYTSCDHSCDSSCDGWFGWGCDTGCNSSCDKVWCSLIDNCDVKIRCCGQAQAATTERPLLIATGAVERENQAREDQPHES